MESERIRPHLVTGASDTPLTMFHTRLEVMPAVIGPFCQLGASPFSVQRDRVLR